MPGIIFEGADASGKSTLARKISEASGRPLYLAGGKPKDDEEMWKMIGDQKEALRGGHLVDRVSSISQQVYRDGLFMRQDLMMEVDRLLEDDNLIVFCRPPTNILTHPKYHEWKPYDTEEWKTNILTNQLTFVNRYDRLMAQWNCVIYDWTSEEGHQIELLLRDIRHPGVMEALRDIAQRTRTP